MIVITVARKPFPKTLVDNIQQNGTGSINIDACRITPTGEWLGGGDEHAETIDKKRSDWSQPWMHRPEDAQRHADMMKEQIKENSLKGRFPSNVVLEHKPGCVSLGLAKVKGSPQINLDKLPVEERIQAGEQHGNIWGRGVGIGVKGVSYTVGFGDESGMEPVQSWDCVGDCPVRQIDVQSGGSKSTGGRTANISTTSVIFGNGKGLGQDISADEVRGDPGYGDLGGASRYFKQIKQDSLVVLSLFDGTSAGRVALERAGLKVARYYASEIDPAAIQVAMNNYPDTIQLGSVERIRGEDLPKIDLIMGGSPCQGFSISGIGGGFSDPRSALFWEYVRLVKECKPKWFLLENVRMKVAYLDIISDALGVQPISINSNLLTAQNRLRFYWTNIPGVDQPEDENVVLSDIIENGVVDREKAHCLDASYYKGGDWEWYMRKKRRQVVFPDQDALRLALSLYKPKPGDMTKEDMRRVKTRLLTPLECERLQTLPEGYTEGPSNMQRYKMIGNGWTVDVIAHILKKIPR